MKKWLESKKIRKHMLEAINIQVREVVEDLIPQRIVAPENEMMSDVRLNIHFELNEKNTEIWSEGHVLPSKTIGIDSFSNRLWSLKKNRFWRN